MKKTKSSKKIVLKITMSMTPLLSVVCFSYNRSRATEGHLVLSVGARRQMFTNYDSCCMGGILIIVAFHVLDLYKFRERGLHMA